MIFDIRFGGVKNVINTHPRFKICVVSRKGGGDREGDFNLKCITIEFAISH